MYPTKNDLPEATRARVVELLNSRLADGIDLQTQMKQAHWNVKGPNFIALHELFDKVYEDVQDYVDLIGERVVQLGGIAQGTARSVAQRSQQKEYPQGLSSGRDHVEAVANALAMFGCAWGDRRQRRASRPRHRRHLHGGVARHRQVVVVRRGPPAG
jgi:starvation-inducible DNA-binding protein